MGKIVLTAFTNRRLLLLAFWWWWAFSGVEICTAVTSDGCDWTGSGLSSTSYLPNKGPLSSLSARQERGVQPLYLRCRQGRIHWSYPSGALRLVLRLQGSGQKEFRACLRPGPVFQGARIYLEGHRRLHLLYSGDGEDTDNGDGSPSDRSSKRRMRCFASVRGQAALYVEAISTGLLGSLRKTVAEFAYDLQPLDKKSYEDDNQECRPCSNEEILQAFCTSDFVVKGTVTALYHNEALGLTELTVRANKVLRDSVPAVFRTRPRKGQGGTPNTKSAVLHRNIKCDTKAGSGQFLFLGRTVLDVTYITCAPRIGQWKMIRTKALMENTNQCQLD